MTAAQVLDRLAAGGCRVAIDGDALDISGPPEVLTDAVVAELRACKPEVIRVLQWRASAAAAGCDPEVLPLVGLTLGEICEMAARRPLGGCPRCGRAAIGFLDFDDGGRLCGRCGGEVAHGA